jgi:hypothetical protein
LRQHNEALETFFGTFIVAAGTEAGFGISFATGIAFTSVVGFGVAATTFGGGGFGAVATGMSFAGGAALFAIAAACSSFCSFTSNSLFIAFITSLQGGHMADMMS